MRILRDSSLSIIALVLFGCFSAARRSAATAPSGAMPEFAERVQDYVALHREVEASQLPLQSTDAPAAIARRQRALADAIRSARRDARRGDIFTPAVATRFRAIIRGDVGETGAEVHSRVPQEKPRVPLRVNEEYPTDQPLSTVPPLLLRQLPPLPDELEYRFVERNLLLLDREANLIVDFLPQAAPANH